LLFFIRLNVRPGPPGKTDQGFKLQGQGANILHPISFPILDHSSTASMVDGFFFHKTAGDFEKFSVCFRRAS